MRFICKIFSEVLKVEVPKKEVVQEDKEKKKEEGIDIFIF